MILTKARTGEAAQQGINRPFCAGAGATVLAVALVVVPYVLTRLRKAAPRARATMDWRSPLGSRADLLLFEAFVTNQRKNTDTRHVEDAHLAIAAFQTGMRDPPALASLRNTAVSRTTGDGAGDDRSVMPLSLRITLRSCWLTNLSMEAVRW
jgi:hypothetical protein